MFTEENEKEKWKSSNKSEKSDKHLYTFDIWNLSFNSRFCCWIDLSSIQTWFCLDVTFKCVYVTFSFTLFP